MGKYLGRHILPIYCASMIEVLFISIILAFEVFHDDI